MKRITTALLAAFMLMPTAFASGERVNITKSGIEGIDEDIQMICIDLQDVTGGSLDVTYVGEDYIVVDIIENTDGYELIFKPAVIGYDGEWLIPPGEYTDIQGGDGLFAVQKFDGGSYGYISLDGEYVIPPRFEEAHGFSEGLAVVSGDGYKGYIDKSGRLVKTFDADSGLSDVSDGVAVTVSYDGTGENPTTEVYDTDFNLLFGTDEYSGIDNFHNGAALAFKSDESGISSVLVDKTGTVVYEFSDAAYIEPYDDDVLVYKMDGQGNLMISIFDYETKTFSEEKEAVTAAGIGSGYFVIGTDDGEALSYEIYNSDMDAVGELKELDGIYMSSGESFAYVRNGNLLYIIADMPQKSDTTTDYENYEEIPVREYDTVVFKAGDNRANVRGEMKLIDSQNADVRTFIKDGRIMLPVRFAAYTLPGCNVYWDGEAKTVTISGDKRIVMTVGSEEAEITEFDSESNDYITRTAELDVLPLISEDRAFIPLRFAAEITGSGVFWDEEGFAFVGAENEEYKKQFEGALLDFADYPVIDGSTATIPLSEALTSRALGISPASASEITYHTKTSNSFSRLINREADLLLSGGLNEEKIAAAAEKGIELEAYAVAKEGFVFMLNKDNPVKNLTTSQIQDIYQGKITNWSELGGNDAEIIPFQRNEDSGSQSIMTRVVMNGLEMMPPKKETLIGAMGEIVDAVAEFDNSENSIGYSVYYYFSQMHNRGEVSLAAVDGVEPSNENIRNGSYPFVIDYCVMIRKDEPEDSPVRKLVDFLLSEEGAKLVADSGFVSVN